MSNRTNESLNFEGLNRWGDLTPTERSVVIEFVDTIASDTTEMMREGIPSAQWAHSKSRERIVRGLAFLQHIEEKWADFNSRK